MNESPKKTPSSQLGLFDKERPFLIPKTITVQDQQNSRFYKISLKQLFCSCGGNQHKQCDHLTRAIEIYLNPRRDHRRLFAPLSALHKEIRRGDLLGIQWANIIARLSSIEVVKKYCHKVILEETRNLSLYEAYQCNDLSPKRWVRDLILSAKKWEIPEFHQHYHQWFTGYETYYRKKEEWSHVGTKELKAKILGYQDPTELYEIHAHLQENKRLTKFLYMVLEERGKAEKTTELLRFLELVKLSSIPSDRYNRMMALELGINYWKKDEATARHPDVEIERQFVPRLEDYVYDVHHHRGIKLLINHWHDIGPGRPMPKGLSLLWSGSLTGNAARFAGCSQFGSLKQSDGSDLPWEKIRIDNWQKVLWFDSIHYEKFYSRLEKANLWSPDDHRHK